ncbi:hypothetical protein, partial [Plasmodium yoelii yoelii]
SKLRHCVSLNRIIILINLFFPLFSGPIDFYNVLTVCLSYIHCVISTH